MAEPLPHPDWPAQWTIRIGPKGAWMGECNRCATFISSALLSDVQRGMREHWEAGHSVPGPQFPNGIGEIG